MEIQWKKEINRAEWESALEGEVQLHWIAVLTLEGWFLEPEAGAEQEIVTGVLRFEESRYRQSKIRIRCGEIAVTKRQRGFWADVIAQARHELEGSHQI